MRSRRIGSGGGREGFRGGVVIFCVGGPLGVQTSLPLMNE